MKTSKANSKRTNKASTKSTAHELGSLIKSCRDIMRKDKGLNGDLDRLPMLTWILFLKFLDDLEDVRKEEANLAGKRFRAAIDAPYRWRDWAAKAQGITGPELIAFINQDEAVRPDSTRGPGLFAYLRSLQSVNGDRRDVIARVFEGTVNRMVNGYLLRDVINKVNEIHFSSKDEIHTLSVLYESLLREVRDAAGDSGEFYTPRPVVKFIVDVIDPRLGETVLDPAAGTGGFLVEAFEHLRAQCKKAEDFNKLQHGTLQGIEAKSLPYLLCEMNLLLHGLEYPEIDSGNALRFPLREIGEKDRVDIVMTNPPFGGEEERGILSNFPEDQQTTETALLFLQFVMRKLRRPRSRGNGGRAAIILPDGILSQEGVATRIRAELINKYNLHTVVRLPRGVFEPYTRSSTSILFFDTTPSTGEVWYYEVGVRAGVKAYSLTQPFEFEELLPCIEWWKRRTEGASAWKVTSQQISGSNFSLNFRNPHSISDYRFDDPESIVASGKVILNKIAEVVIDLGRQWDLVNASAQKGAWPVELFGTLARKVEREEVLTPNKNYPSLAMSWYGKGLYVKHTKTNKQIKAKKLYRVAQGDFVYNRLFAWKGSFAEATKENDGCYVSNEFPCFEIDHKKIAPGYLWAYFAQPAVWDYIEGLSTGTTSTSRLRLKEAKLEQFRIPVPPRPIQEALAKAWQRALELEKQLDEATNAFSRLAPAMLERSVQLKP